jgi:catechol 2,3-dioxygenase-like lactoylglutathione lyase family enzyme
VNAQPKLSPTALDDIDHIAVPVENVKEAVEWYTKQFKCTIAYQDDTWAYLKFNNIHLALVIPSQHPLHIAFAVDDAEQYGKLKPHRDGTRSVYVNDPAGNSVEMIEKSSLKY